MDTGTTRDMGRQTPSTAEVLEGLNDLLQLDHDAIGVYEIAIEKLQDRDNASQIAGFKLDHERHIRELNQVISELGGTPINEPHATGPLKEALQSLGGLAGDKGVLMAWRTNELQVRTKYDGYASRAAFWPDNVKRLIDRNALDEERHYEWIIRVLQSMGLSTGDDLETGLATRMREGATQAGDLAHRAREKAEDVVDTARARVTELAGTARERASNLADAAGERASEMGTGAKNRVAGGLDAAANRLEGVTGPDAPGGPRADDAAHRVAGGMHSGAEYLRSSDWEQVRTDLERSARQSPLRTLAVLFATGFVVGRLLR